MSWRRKTRGGAAATAEARSRQRVPCGACRGIGGDVVMLDPWFGSPRAERVAELYARADELPVMEVYAPKRMTGLVACGECFGAGTVKAGGKAGRR
jgi:hypothetical protein